MISLDILIPTLVIVAFVNMTLGAVILSRGLRNFANVLFGLIAFIAALWSLSIIGFYSPDFRSLADWTIFTHFFAVTIAALFFYFSGVFPRNIIGKYFLVYVAAFFPLLLSVYELFFVTNIVSSSSEGISYILMPGYVGYAATVLFYFLGGYVHLLFQFRQGLSSFERLQVRDVFVGSVLASTLAIVPDLVFPFINIFTFTWLGPIFTLILVFSIFIGILRHHLFSIKVILTEVFAGFIIVVQSLQLLLSDSPNEVWMTASLLALISILGYLLIRGVYQEVNQREKIEVLAKDLSETNDRQEKLIHFIGHEVKGYLTKGEYAFSELVDGDYGTLTPQVKTLSETALLELRKGVTAVTDILKAANLKRGTVAYDMKPTDIRAALKEEVVKLGGAAKEKGLQLITEIDEAGTYSVNLDRTQFCEHVIRNLIDNAIRYTPSGSVTVGLRRNGPRAQLTVADTGVGITAEDKARLFTEGGRGKDSIKVNVHSTGYGLYIAKNIVVAHGGTISAESEGPGKGSTFTIELPLL